MSVSMQGLGKQGRAMRAGFKPFLLLVAALATGVLALVVLISHPSNEIDLLAGAGLATAFGWVVFLAPEVK
jgi:hypothetical protein